MYQGSSGEEDDDHHICPAPEEVMEGIIVMPARFRRLMDVFGSLARRIDSSPGSAY
jgi:hypothetical protein